MAHKMIDDYDIEVMHDRVSIEDRQQRNREQRVRMEIALDVWDRIVAFVKEGK